MADKYENLAEGLAEILFQNWPYRSVDAVVVSECQLCRCLVVDRLAHAKACFSSMDEVRTIGNSMSALLDVKGGNHD